MLPLGNTPAEIEIVGYITKVTVNTGIFGIALQNLSAIPDLEAALQNKLVLPLPELKTNYFATSLQGYYQNVGKSTTSLTGFTDFWDVVRTYSKKTKYIPLTKEQQLEVVNKLSDNSLIHNITNHLLKQEYTAIIRQKPIFKTYNEIPQDLVEILIGMMLGDLSMKVPLGKCEGNFVFGQSTIHYEYALHFFNKFKHAFNLGNGCLNIMKSPDPNAPYLAVNIQSKTHPLITALWHLFYDVNGKKIVPQNIEDILTSKGLAYWYLDDGNVIYNETKTEIRGINLNTQGFDLESIIRLQNALRHKFNIETNSHKETSDVSGLPLHKLYIGRAYVTTFLDIIKPEICDIKGMEYKYDTIYTYKQQTFENLIRRALGNWDPLLLAHKQQEFRGQYFKFDTLQSLMHKSSLYKDTITNNDPLLLELKKKFDAILENEYTKLQEKK